MRLSSLCTTAHASLPLSIMLSKSRLCGCLVKTTDKATAYAGRLAMLGFAGFLVRARFCQKLCMALLAISVCPQC